MSAFIKWVGGKNRAMKTLLPVLLAESFECYFEPFLGGGSPFLALSTAGAIQEAVLSDVNSRLIQAWKQVQNEPDEVLEWLSVFEEEDGAELFEDLRDTFNTGLDSFARVRGFEAAVFIYLNRACYNGLYRENKKGHFNASFAGPPHRVLGKNICLEERVLAAAGALRNAVVVCEDFETIIAGAGQQDLVYVDPPYHKTSQQPYTTGDFTEDDHRRLARALRAAVCRGSHVVVSNADTPFIRGLYQGFTALSSSRVNSINYNIDDRASKPDLVITSF